MYQIWKHVEQVRRKQLKAETKDNASTNVSKKHMAVAIRENSGH